MVQYKWKMVFIYGKSLLFMIVANFKYILIVKKKIGVSACGKGNNDKVYL